MDFYITITNKDNIHILCIPLWIKIETSSKTNFNIYDKPIKSKETRILKFEFNSLNNIKYDNFFFIGYNYSINYKNKIYNGYLFFKLEDLKNFKTTELYFYI